MKGFLQGQWTFLYAIFRENKEKKTLFFTILKQEEISTEWIRALLLQLRGLGRKLVVQIAHLISPWMEGKRTCK